MPPKKNESKSKSLNEKKTRSKSISRDNSPVEKKTRSKTSTKDAGTKKKYKQISMRESIMTRSMWAGSNKTQDLDTYVFEKDKFVLSTLNYPPALYKMIDEIMVNVIDQWTKHGKISKIYIDLDKQGIISIMNNGSGITIEENENIQGKKMYSPQLIFSEMLSGENNQDDENTARIVGGQNGIGAKITSVLSDLFIVETCDEENQVYYKQEFRDGLLTIDEPLIISLDDKKSINQANLGKHQLSAHTKITFLPKYKEHFKLNIKDFYLTLYQLLHTRAWYASAYTGLEVQFTATGKSSEKIHVKKFSDFCYMFTDQEIYTTQATSDIYEKLAWDICIGTTDGKERQVSMINGIITNNGGTHIKHIQNMLVENLKEKVEKEIKKSGVKFNKNYILNNVFIFMKGNIVNPDFTSQTKDELKVPIKQIADYIFSSTAWSKIWTLLQEVILSTFLKKQIGETNLRANRGKVSVPMYSEAENCRDKKKCHDCGLIITEGLSATGTVNKGLLNNKSNNPNSKFTYDWFGVYSIKGVPMNGLKESTDPDKKKSRKKTTKLPSKKSSKKVDEELDNEEEEDEEDEAFDNVSLDLQTALQDIPLDISKKRLPNAKIRKNERIESLMKVLGLQYSCTYDFTAQGEKEWQTLRYGFIAGLTDQDLDGFNIFGLLSTYFLTFWPSLVKRGFIRRINTPLVRVYPIKSKAKSINAEEFYTEKQFSDWIEKVGSDYVNKNYQKPKYYKGLGSHQEHLKEVTRMFEDIDDKLCTYVLDENAIRSMYIFYGQDTAPRKIALSSGTTEEIDAELTIPLSKHFEIETRSFQRDNIIRKLLSAVDGFVESRRKVFYTARLVATQEIKVASLGGEVSSKANYHHGEASVEQTIIRMAQAYPMARNLPLLQPRGGFGNRDQGYKDFASSRYIYTSLNKRLADKLFRREDDFILPYNVDDGERYEPKYYIPIIPYAICENNDLPATGWKITIYARDLKAIFTNLRRMIRTNSDKCEALPIDLSQYKGKIKKANGKFYFLGDYEYDEKANTVTIKELPPSTFSKAYIGESISQKKDKTKDSVKGIKGKEWVLDAKDDTTDDGVNIVLQLKEGAYDAITEKYGNENFDSFEEYFELKEAINDKINLVDEQGNVLEFKTYEDVFVHWYKFRKDLYIVRVERDTILTDLEIQMLKNMQRFSTEHHKYGITNKTTIEELILILKQHKYNIYNISLLNNPKYTDVKELIELITLEKHGADYDYLISMGYKTLTKAAYMKRQERIKELEEHAELLAEDEKKGKFRGAMVWLRELDELEEAIIEGRKTKWFYSENVDYSFERKNRSKAVAKKGKRIPKKNDIEDE